LLVTGTTKEKGPDTGPEAAQTLIAALLQKGSFKAAVDAAKQYHASAGTSESEALLLDAYLARIQGMFEKNMVAEAVALLDLVQQRHPSSRQPLESLRREYDFRCGNIDSTLRLLAQPEPDPENRGEIETLLKRRLIDLEALAQSTALPREHPLRQQALVLARAFKAVCSGPVEEQSLALEEVPRRSPLAPWKMLIRAIAAFYRNDDTACGDYARAIDPDSAPAFLAPLLLQATSQKPIPETASPKQRELVTGITGDSPRLRHYLEDINLYLERMNYRRLESALRNSLRECREQRPDLLERLKQHISVQMYLADMPSEHVRLLLGGPSRKDAHFWQLMARGDEGCGRGLASLPYWEEFRLHALHERWFPAGGIEEAVLYLHMADLAVEFLGGPDSAQDREFFRTQFKGLDHYYDDQSPEVRSAVMGKRATGPYWVEPNELFARACANYPDPESFRKWIAWANNANPKIADEAALKWCEARPNDPEPFLHLAESAEKRNALGKALGFLQQAEILDRLNPAVGRARLRLLIACAKRHMLDRKPHLLMKDIADLQALPQMSQGDRAAFIAALKWIQSIQESNAEAAGVFYAEAATILQSEETAFLLLLGILREIKSKHHLEAPALNKGAELIEHVARACQLGSDLGITPGLPSSCVKRLTEALSRPKAPGNASQHAAIAETALGLDLLELGYLAAGAGLRSGGGPDARLLLLRVRCMPFYDYVRRRMCLSVAVTLARRTRDTALAAEVIELYKGHIYSFCTPWDAGDGHVTLEASDDQVARVLELEKSLFKTATRTAPDPRYQRQFERYVENEPYYPEGDYDDEGEYDDEFDEEDFDDESEFSFEEFMQTLRKQFNKFKSRGPRTRKKVSSSRDDNKGELAIEMAEAMRELIKTVPGPFGDTPPYKRIAELNPALAKEMDALKKKFFQQRGREIEISDYMKAFNKLERDSTK
jgi:hypothetical protein